MRLIQLALLCLFCLTSIATAEPLRVMSFNLRFGDADDGTNSWPHRKELVAKTARQFGPDLLGTQETLKYQADFLKQQLEGYTYFGRSRMETPNEHCGIFYRTARFTWLAGGHFWLSEQPERPQSKSWDSSLPRMATWVLLQDRQADSQDHATVLFLNTHFDHRGRQARLESAKLISKRLQKLAATTLAAQLVVTGDFNAGEGSPPYQAFFADGAALVDTYRVTHPERGEQEGTFNGFQGRDRGARIDWILASPTWKVKSAEIDRTHQDERFPSDHFPVTAVLTKP